MRENFFDIFGNEKTKSSIGKSIIDNTLAHAYIIEGPEGSGKKTLAYRIAAALACENKHNGTEKLPCMHCPSCLKVLSGNSPDVYLLKREDDKASIGVNSVREMRADMFLSANESEYKVYIINEAHLLLTAAQNALLKVLEEPPPNVLILLLCNTTDTILPTVKSRAQIIRMSLFDSETMGKYLLQKSSIAREFQRESETHFLVALEASQGSIGKALSLMNRKKMANILKQRQITDSIISAIIEKSDFQVFSDAFSLLSSKRLDLIDELTLLYTAIRDLILIKRSADVALMYYYERSSASEISKKIGISRLYAISDAVFTALCDLSQNSNIGLTINALLYAIKKN